MSAGGRFLARWSRLKKAAETASTVEVPDAETLLANLGPDSDFGVFLRQEVSEAVRRQAMKTLFADPHFNVMDGLDIYIDDYSLAEPIPEAMLATLQHAREMLATPAAEGGAALPPPATAPACDNLTSEGQNVAPIIPPENPASQKQ